jgi:hypothetical protein
LAFFQYRRYLEVNHPEQCIACVLKYCSNNSNSGHTSRHKLLNGGRSAARSDELHYSAASRISSTYQCFDGICIYWWYHIKPTVTIPWNHLPGQKRVLTSGPADVLEKVMSQPLERYFGRPSDCSYGQLALLEYHSRNSVHTHPMSNDAHSDVCERVHFTNQRRPTTWIMNSVHPKNYEWIALRLLFDGLTLEPGKNRKLTMESVSDLPWNC